MLYWLYLELAARMGWSPDGNFTQVLFRAALAIMLSFTLVILFGPRIIRWLLAQKVGDRPEFHNATLNELMKGKKNTPTMGGILIIGAVVTTTLLLARLDNNYVKMAIFCMVYLACLGGIDDYLKLTAARRGAKSRDGLVAWEKLLFQIGLGVLLAVFIYMNGREVHLVLHHTSPDLVKEVNPAHVLNWPFIHWKHELPLAVFSILTVLVITGTSNAVNLTDGMDGLAGGCMAIVSFAFLVLSYLTGDYRMAEKVNFNWIQFTGELAIVCGAMTGACLGFLWFNCNPAQVFMGDTGSLSLGGTIGYVAIVIRQEPMLLLVGGIFVVEALSVMMQVSYFRATGGKRIFLCSPIHHHFHMKGWSETQVVVRFWLVCALCAAFALATVKLR